ncbi:helix-hairpin-helix domain-containing protein [Halorubrum sp. DTA46]|uniref:helix-hairpin-helix domain-containing protein n=1 Tax=Halorubrum sp. DTA46 TaxID=3402162 RepID=UPI003AAB6F5B
MSDWYETRDDTVRLGEAFQLEEIRQLEVEKLETIERAAIERLITGQQESLVRLQTDVLEVKTERNALERQLSTLEDERGRLQDRIRELEANRPALEPKTVFANLGAALQEVDDDLKGERYRVDDVDFTLKTNVIQTEDGLRMHLPSLDETSASANLSEVSFRLRAPRGEPKRERPRYTDVPDLRGLSREVAARRLASAELAVGAVDRIADPDAAPGTVVEQFPEPYTVAEPEAPVDLVLAAESEPESEPAAEPESEDENEHEASDDADEPAGRDADANDASNTRTDPEDDRETDPEDDRETDLEDDDRESGDDERARMETFRRAIAEVDPENGDAVVDRLRRAGVTDLESLIRPDPEELAETLSIPADRIVALQEGLGGDREPIALEAVSGIGPTYASRLRDAGVQNASQLATLDPETVADVARVSTSRTGDWIEQAQRMAKGA